MLTPAEQKLVTCATRIMTAIKYKEAHPERTFHYMEENLVMEMVRTMYLIRYSTIRAHYTQQYIMDIYKSDPSPKEQPHHMHPAVSALAWEQREAHEQNRLPAYSTITFAQIKRRIAAVPASHPTWPTVHRVTDLSAKAEADPQFTWWLVSEEEELRMMAEQAN